VTFSRHNALNCSCAVRPIQELRPAAGWNQLKAAAFQLDIGLRQAKIGMILLKENKIMLWTIFVILLVLWPPGCSPWTRLPSGHPVDSLARYLTGNKPNM
jgi:hypothetical protein